MNQYTMLTKAIAAHLRTLRGRLSKDQRTQIEATVSNLRAKRNALI